MKLTGPEGDFELTILDYEYCDSARFLERNWLLVAIKTRFKGRVFRRVAPLLATWEVEMLLNWLRSLVNGRVLSSKLTFVEPDLGFKDLGNHRVQIKLAAETAPDWNTNSSNPFWLPVTADLTQLQTAIHDLEQQLGHFPVRD